MTSLVRATIIAIAAVGGMILGFVVVLYILSWVAPCSRDHLCESLMGGLVIALIAAPFSGVACAYLTLKMLERHTRKRESFK